MSTTHALPPFHHLAPARSITSFEALSNIQSYLASSTTQAHLHPDCIFVERVGPTFSSSASVGGVVLQQLRRMEAGLRGVWMGVVPDFDGVDRLEKEEHKPSASTAVAVAEEEVVSGRRPRESGEAGRRGRRVETVDDVDGTMRQDDTMGDDVANYQEQLYMQGERILAGEIGERSNVVGHRKSAPIIQSTAAGDENADAIVSGAVRADNAKKRKRDEIRTDSARKMTKEERRAAKKARNKEEKAERAENRRDGGYDEVHGDESGGVQESATNGVSEDVDMLDHEDNARGTDVVAEEPIEDDRARRRAEKAARKKARVDRAVQDEEVTTRDNGDEEGDRARRKAEKRARKHATSGAAE